MLKRFCETTDQNRFVSETTYSSNNAFATLGCEKNNQICVASTKAGKTSVAMIGGFLNR
jgi:hypothetical protein